MDGMEGRQRMEAKEVTEERNDREIKNRGYGSSGGLEVSK
jgi:hypothetical protein